MAEEVVYVLGTPGSNTVKIGRTTDLPKRLAAIQRMSPVPLVVLWTHPGSYELETKLHRHFAALRSHGEWFHFESDPIPVITAAVQAVHHPTDLPPARSRLDQASQEQWRAILDEATADHAKHRSALEELIADCRAAGLPLTLIAEHTPFSREWVRKIADRLDRERAA